MKRVFEQGQTLIETLVAIFILVMGVTSAVGLAIYAFGSSTTITKQIIGNGLAREGLEAVRNMRDTNWLKLTTIDSTCYNFVSGAQDDNCYKQWLNPPGSGSTAQTAGYNIGAAGSYRLVSDTVASDKFWQLVPAASNFGLEFDSNFTNPGFNGFYTIPNPAIGLAAGSSGYYRKIVLSFNMSPPYNTDLGPELQVTSQVWWTDKNCPASADWPGTGKCSVALTTNLTNWKNY